MAEGYATACDFPSFSPIIPSLGQQIDGLYGLSKSLL